MMILPFKMEITVLKKSSWLNMQILFYIFLIVPDLRHVFYTGKRYYIRMLMQPTRQDV